MLSQDFLERIRLRKHKKISLLSNIEKNGTTNIRVILYLLHTRIGDFEEVPNYKNVMSGDRYALVQKEMKLWFQNLGIVSIARYYEKRHD